MSEGIDVGGRELGALAGAAIGIGIASLGGPPNAGYYGFAIGYNIGAYLDPDQLDDKIPSQIKDGRVQTSMAGRSLPRIHGLGRTAGNIIWSMDIVSTEKRTDIGTKSSKQQETSYTYRLPGIAIALSQGVQGAIVRVWAGNELVIDRMPDGAPTPGSFAARQTLTGAVAFTGAAKAVRFYPGNATQLPDPLMVQVLGSDKTPAYRGTCYVVIEDLDLGPFGDQVPQFTVDIVSADAGLSVNLLYQWVNESPSANSYTAFKHNDPRSLLLEPTIDTVVPNLDFTKAQIYTSLVSDKYFAIYPADPTGVSPSNHLRMRAWYQGEVEYDVVLFSDLVGFSESETEALKGNGPQSARDNALYPRSHPGPADEVLVGELLTPRFDITYQTLETLIDVERTAEFNRSRQLGSFSIDAIPLVFQHANKGPNSITFRQARSVRYLGAEFAAIGTEVNKTGAVTITDAALSNGSNLIGVSVDQPFEAAYLLVKTATNTYDIRIPKFFTFYYSNTNTTLIAAPANATPLSNSELNTDDFGVQILTSRDTLFSLENGRYIDWYFRVSRTVLSLVPANSIDLVTAANPYRVANGLSPTTGFLGGSGRAWEIAIYQTQPEDVDDALLIFDHSANKGGVYTYGVGITQEFDLADPITPGLVLFTPVVSCYSQGILITPQYASNMGSYSSNLNYFGLGAITSTLTLATAVDVVVGESQLAPSEFDTSDLEPLSLLGFTQTRQTSMNQDLSSLQKAFQFEVVERDGVLEFLRRGKPAVAKISTTDLGVAEGLGAPQSTISLVRKQEVDLTKVLYVKFQQSTVNNEQGSVAARRTITTAGGSETVSLPIVLTTQQAKDIADILLYNSWAERIGFDIAVGSKWAWLSPGDTIEIDSQYGLLSCRINEKEFGAPGIVQFRGVTEVLGVYRPDTDPEFALGDPRYLTPPVPTCLAVLDISVSRPRNNSSGAFVGVCGLTAEWQGATINRAPAGGKAELEAVSTRLSTVVGSLRLPLVYGPAVGIDMLNSISLIPFSVDEASLLLLNRSTIDVAAGANLCVVVDPNQPENYEYIGFETVVQETNGSFTLTGLRRGQRGSGKGLQVNKLHGSTFVLISTEADTSLVTHISANTAEEASGGYEARSTGGAKGQKGFETSHRSSDNSRRPDPPANLFLDSGNQVLTWARTSRFERGITDGDTVTIDDDVLGWQIEVYGPTDTSARATYVVTSKDNNWHYPLARQALDFPELDFTGPDVVPRYTFTVYALATGIASYGAKIDSLGDDLGRPSPLLPWMVDATDNLGGDAVQLSSIVKPVGRETAGRFDRVRYSLVGDNYLMFSLPDNAFGLQNATVNGSNKGDRFFRRYEGGATDNNDFPTVFEQKTVNLTGLYTDYVDNFGGFVLVGPELKVSTSNDDGESWDTYTLPRFSIGGSTDVNLIGVERLNTAVVAYGDCAYMAESLLVTEGSWTQYPPTGLPPLLRIKKLIRLGAGTTYILGFDLSSDRLKLFRNTTNPATSGTWVEVNIFSVFNGPTADVGDMAISGTSEDNLVIVGQKQTAGVLGPAIAILTISGLTVTDVSPAFELGTPPGVVGGYFDKVVAGYSTALAYGAATDNQGNSIMAYSIRESFPLTSPWAHYSPLSASFPLGLTAGLAKPLALRPFIAGNGDDIMGLAPAVGGILARSNDGEVWRPLNPS